MATPKSDVEANRELLRRETGAVESGDLDVFDELYAEDVTVGLKRTGSDAPVVSREDVKALYREWTTAFPDLSVEVTHSVAEGDLVMEHVVLRGTHEGTFRGVEPTGNEIEVDGFHLRRIADGKVVETHSMVGMGTLVTQLGLDVPLQG